MGACYAHDRMMVHFWGALQIQDQSPQSTNWQTLASCNGKFSRERWTTARPVSEVGRLIWTASVGTEYVFTRPVLDLQRDHQGYD